MNEIKAYVREVMLEHVIAALAEIEALRGFAVVHLREYGHVDNGGLTRVDMAKLEVDVPEALTGRVVDAIVSSARTGAGHPGDGKVFVSELREAVRISDGRRDEDAVARSSSGDDMSR